MLTAAITASIGAVLALFGVEPGAYLVGVAVVVKITIIAAGVLFGARFMKRRRAQIAATATAPRPDPVPAAQDPPTDVR